VPILYGGSTKPANAASILAVPNVEGGLAGGGCRWAKVLGMVRLDFAEAGTELEVQILGERRRVTVVPESPYDPENARLRA
jgi:dimethylglycine dehydrogenase